MKYFKNGPMLEKVTGHQPPFRLRPIEAAFATMLVGCFVGAGVLVGLYDLLSIFGQYLVVRILLLATLTFLIFKALKNVPAEDLSQEKYPSYLGPGRKYW